MRPLPSLIALAILSSASGGAPGDALKKDPGLRLSYQITIEPDEKRVQVEGTLLGRRPAGSKGYMSLGLKKLVKIGQQAGEDQLAFAYQLPIEQADFRDPFQPVLNGEHFAGFLSSLLVAPKIGGGKLRKITLNVAAPKGWKVATSRGFEAEATFDKLNDLAGTLVCAGDYTTHSFALDHKGRDASTKFYVAIRGKRDWDDAKFVEEFKRLARGQMDYFGGAHPAPVQFLALHLLPKGAKPNIPAFNRRAPGHDTILALHTPERPRDNFEFLGMLAHEHLHNWYPNAMRSDLGPWFMEGLNDYVAYRGLLANGLHTRDQFTGMLSKWYREYLFCVRTKNERLMPYRRGMIAGWVLDVELRRSTDGKKGLTDVLLALIEDKPEGGIVQRSHFLAMLAKTAGSDMEPLYKHLVEDEGAIDLAKHLQGTGFNIPDGKPSIVIDPNSKAEKTLFEAILSE